MNVWRRWVEQPQRVWLRRALFQVHLWTGLALGLYIVVLSISGSVLVYRTDLDQFFSTARPAFDRNATRLSAEELRAAAQRQYPGWEVTSVSERISRRDPAIHVVVSRAGEEKERLFNPYTGADLGDSVTSGELRVIWIAHLHDDLLFGRPGRYWNGALSAVMTLTVLTGAIVWWPGLTRWRRSLFVTFSSGWRRINWELHSVMGAWLFLFMLVWGISGIYLGIPDPFVNLVDAVSDPNGSPGDRPGDLLLLWLTRLHFGRWRGNEPLRALWALVGLVPAAMLITGVIMWWSRVVRPALRRRRALRTAAGRAARV